MVAIGATLGIAAGIACARFIEALLFEIKATDLSATLAPVAVLFATAAAAAVPPLIRAIRIDPAQTLRSE
jgi:putative ABC transport system permease protein